MPKVHVKLNAEIHPTFEIPGLVSLSSLGEETVIEKDIDIATSDNVSMEMLLRGVSLGRISIPQDDIKKMQENMIKTLGTAQDASKPREAYIVKLADHHVVWATQDQKVSLNRLEKHTFMEVTKTGIKIGGTKFPALSKTQLKDLNNAVNAGILEIIDEAPKGDSGAPPVADQDYDRQLSAQDKMLRLILDSPFEQFEEMVVRFKVPELRQLKVMEDNDRKRPDVIKLLNKRIAAEGGG